MLSGIYSAGTALQAAQRAHEMISHNLAHLNVPGFRRSDVSFSEFVPQLGSVEPDDQETGHGALVESVTTDFSKGVLAHTGRNLDVAINGEGFFTVEGPDGPLYTRNGVFHLTKEGQLVTAGGHPLQGSSGTISIPNNVSASQIHIGNDGTISAEGTQLGQIEIVSFENNNQLIPAGTSMFRAPDGVESQEANVSLAQGIREQSNVSAVDEMVHMITAMRHYEAAQRVMKTIDEAVSNNTNPQTV